MFMGENQNGGKTEDAASSVMIESPTGSGKTTMALVISKIMSELLGTKIGWVALRENLLDQAREEAVRHNLQIENIKFISMFDKSPQPN
jgi:superfamily II DNA or RNA helicase